MKIKNIELEKEILTLKKMINKTHVEGLLYEHKLEERESGPASKNPGTPYIRGSVDIATDDDCLNIVTVDFTYITEKTSKGNTNATYAVLKNIIDGKIKSVMGTSKEEATKLRIDSAIGLNEFYSREGDLVSYSRNEGGFAHTTDKLNADEGVRATFEIDMIITSTIRKEADLENDTPEKVLVKGAVFNFRNELLPVEFVVNNPNGMNYFEDLGATPNAPVFTKVWGRQESQTIVTTKTEENAFGEAKVVTSERKKREFVITGTSVDTYTWDDESSITAIELKKCMEDREIKLADLKKKQEEYQANKTVAPTAPAAGSFSF